MARRTNGEKLAALLAAGDGAGALEFLHASLPHIVNLATDERNIPMAAPSDHDYGAVAQNLMELLEGAGLDETTMSTVRQLLQPLLTRGGRAEDDPDNLPFGGRPTPGGQMTPVREMQNIERAKADTRSVLGASDYAYDSAAAVYAHALRVMGVRTPGVSDAVSLSAIFRAQRDHRRSRNQPLASPVAMDSSRAKGYFDRFPGAEHIETV